MSESAPARSPELERALSLQKELESSDLTIIDLKNQFLRKDFTNLTDSALSKNPTNPRIVAPDVQAQQVGVVVLCIVFIRRGPPVVLPEETQVSLYRATRERQICQVHR